MNRHPDSIEIVDRRMSSVDHLGSAGNTYIVRSSAAIVCAVSLVLGLLLAPFTHVHVVAPEADHPGHGSALVHSHFSGRASRHSENASVSANNDNASGPTQLDVFNFATPAPITIPDIPTTGFQLPEVRDAFGRVMAPTVRVHGPPFEVRPASEHLPPSSV